VFTPIPDPAIWDYIPGSMLTGATAVELAPGLAHQVSLHCTKGRRLSFWIFVNSVGNVSKHVQSKAQFCINFLLVLPKQETPPIFLRYDSEKSFTASFFKIIKEDIRCLKN
jgi:hypothetical protein